MKSILERFDMGSFLMKCFISKQTILEGQDCVIIPIKKTFDVKCSFESIDESIFSDNNKCTKSTYIPVGVKIDVLADDYGFQNIVDSHDNRVSLVSLFKSLVASSLKTKQGENPHHEKSFNFKEMLKLKAPTINKIVTDSLLDYSSWNWDEVQQVPFSEFTDLWEDLHSLIVDNRVFVKNIFNKEPTQLGFAICLKSAYDHLANLNYESNETVINIDKKADGVSKFSTPLMIAYMEFNHRFEIINDQLEYYAMKFTLDKKEKNIVNRIIEAQKYLWLFANFQDNMYWLQLRYEPMAYSGQDYRNEIGKVYQKLVNEVVEQQNMYIKKVYG